MTFGYKYRKQIIFSVALLVIIGLIISSLVIKKFEIKDKDDIKKAVVLKKNTETKKDEIKQYKVDIKGEVNNPGIYTMLENDRVIDVINKANGLTEIADTTVINLSKKVTDEMVIVIYSKQEVINYKKTKEEEKKTLEICTNNEKEIINNACIDSEKTTTKNDENKTTDTKVNINTATKEELMKIPGIGEAKADNIIKYRTDKKFNSIEDVKNISGIGEAVFAKIKENITV